MSASDKTLKREKENRYRQIGTPDRDQGGWILDGAGPTHFGLGLRLVETSDKLVTRRTSTTRKQLKDASTGKGVIEAKDLLKTIHCTPRDGQHGRDGH